MAVRDEVEDVGVLGLPPLEPVLLAVRGAVHFDESQELPHQPVAGTLERVHGALETLEEAGADQADDLLLASPVERGDLFVVADVVVERVVDRETEHRMFLVERGRQLVEQVSVGLLQRVVGNLGWFAFGEGRLGAAFLLLTALDVGPAALNDEFLEQVVLVEDVVCQLDVGGDVLYFDFAVFGLSRDPDLFVQRPGHGSEPCGQVVDAQCPPEVTLVLPGEQLDEVPEVGETVVDRGGSEHVHGLRPC